MNKNNVVSKCKCMSLRVLFSYLFFLCVLCGQISAQEFKTVKDGIEYAEVTREISGLKVNMNLLRLDLTKVRLDVHHAMDMAIGTEKTSSIATRHGAFAAINAGFFRLDTSIFAGDPVGALMIDGQLLSESTNGRVALQIINAEKETKIQLGHLDVVAWLAFDETTRFQTKLSGVNRERGEDEMILFDPRFGRSTSTKGTGTEIVLRDCRIGSKKKPYWFACKNIELKEGANATIPAEGAVISIAPGNSRQKQLVLYDLKLYLTTKKKKEFLIRLESDPQKRYLPFDKNMDIVAGVPQLIKDGKIDITWEQEKTTKSFVEMRHPRTAVAKLKDGKFLMITVDGRTEASGGIGLQDLAEYLLSLGAIDAMNLDGGGSTTMFLDGKVVNKPSDKEGERKVSDAILVTLRNKR